MDDIVYSILLRYFSTLSNLGYVKDNTVYNILFLVIVRDFIYNDFRGFINSDDYRDIEKALYSVFGTSCLIPYPEFCMSSCVNKLHLGDISELANRVKVNENNITKLQNTKVVKKLVDISKVNPITPDSN